MRQLRDYKLFVKLGHLSSETFTSSGVKISQMRQSTDYRGFG